MLGRLRGQLMDYVLSSQSRLTSSRGFSSWVERYQSAFGLVVAAKSGGFVAGVVPPVGLHEDGVDLFEIDGCGAISDGFDEAADAEVFNGTQGAFGDTEDEGSGIVGDSGYAGVRRGRAGRSR